MEETEHTNYIISDAPLADSKGDILNRREFANTFGRLIRDYSGIDSLVLGVYAEWGMGKTSLVNMVKEGIEAESVGDSNAPIIIHFSPWYFSGQDKLLRQFFSQIVSSLKSDRIKDVEKAAKIIADLIEQFGGLIDYVPPLSPEIVAVKEGWKFFAKKSESVKRGSDTDIETLKENIANKLKEFDRKILIIIDDIDRLDDKEILEIFKLVKGVADFPNLIYMLCFDEAIAQEALKETHSGDPKKHLEKIVQIPINLPAISKSAIEKKFIEVCEKNIPVIFEPPYRQYLEEVYSAGIENYFTNIREVNRFANILYFKLPLLEASPTKSSVSPKYEINPVDFMVLTIIESKDRESYKYISENRIIFCGVDSDHDAYFKLIPEMIAHAPDSSTDALGEQNRFKYLRKLYEDGKNKNKFMQIELIEPVLKKIFPYFSNILYNPNSTEEIDSDRFAREQRVADPDYFSRAFELNIPDGQIPDTIVSRIIDLQSDAASLVARVDSYSYYQKCIILEKLVLRADEIMKENIEPICVLISCLGENIDEHEIMGRDILGLDFRVRQFISALAEIQNHSIAEQLGFYKNFISNDSIGVYMSIKLLDAIEYKLNFKRDGNIEFPRDEVRKTEFGNQYLEIADIVHNKIKAAAENGVLETHNDFLRIIYVWKSMNPDEAKAYVLRLSVGDAHSVVNLLTGFMYYRYSGNVQEILHSGRAYNDFELNVYEIDKHANNIKSSSLYEKLSEKSRAAINAFINREATDDAKADWYR